MNNSKYNQSQSLTDIKELNNSQLNLIEESLTKTISQLDYLGEDPEKIKQFKNLRDNLFELKRNQKQSKNIYVNRSNDDKSRLYKEELFVYDGSQWVKSYLSLSDLIQNQNIEIPELNDSNYQNYFVEELNEIGLDSILDVKNWLENKGEFQGIVDLSNEMDEEDEETSPALTLVKLNKRQLHYLSLITIYRVNTLCSLMYSNDPINIEYFANNVHEYINFLNQNIAVLNAFINKNIDVNTT